MKNFKDMRSAFLFALCAALVLPGPFAIASNKSVVHRPSVLQLGWKLFSDHRHHFRFEYPATWKVNVEPFSMMHYRQVFCSVNSLGKNRFYIREQQTALNQSEFGERVVTNQLPPGAAYLDIGWWETPSPRFGPKVQEMIRRDLSQILEAAKETETADLVQRQVEFSKWGRRWSIMIYLRPPVTAETRRGVERVLTSFRFDDFPARDPIWAIGEARKKLPPEADPERFEREGGSDTHYVSTSSDGEDVLVTFRKRDAGQPAKIWRFRVTSCGKVEMMPSANLISDPH
jgi:hypothetical protein